MIEITPKNFDEDVRKSSIPVLLDVHAPWCGTCRDMAPAFEEAVSRLGSAIRPATLDLDEYEPLARSLDIDTLPTFILFAAGKQVARIEGRTEAAQIEAMVRTGKATT